MLTVISYLSAVSWIEGDSDGTGNMTATNITGTDNELILRSFWLTSRTFYPVPFSVTYYMLHIKQAKLPRRPKFRSDTAFSG